MKVSKRLLSVIGLPIAFVLATTGCATKKYAREQAGTVNQRVSDVEKKSNEQIAALGDKTQKDISRVDERAMTAENKATEAGRAAQQADAKAGQAGELARNAHQLAEQDQAKIGELGQTIENSNKYRLFDTQDVLFGFDKSALTTDAKSTLDQLVQKTAGMARPVYEVEGFTDTTGSTQYNLALSRRRADAVVRYLVSHNIPLRSIHMIGLGEEQPSMTQATEGNAQSPAAPQQTSKREMRKQARRVVIRVYAPETSLAAKSGTSSQSMQPGQMSQPPAQQSMGTNQH